MSLKQVLKSKKYTYTDFSKDIANGLGKEWNEAYYQHIVKIINSDIEPDSEEEKVIDIWLRIHRDPNEFIRLIYVLGNAKKKLRYIKECLLGRRYNRNEVKKLMDKLLNSL